MIGCGLIARAHGLATERTDANIRFTSCSSRSIESAKDFAGEFSVPATYDTHNELLAHETPAGVVIAAPPDAHSQIILDCLHAGVRFVLCEKPLTMNASEAEALRDAVVAAGAILLEGFMYRHHPQIAAMRDLLADAACGEVDQVFSTVNMFDASEDGEALPKNWRRDAVQGGGVLHDFLCYPIDLSNLIVNAEPVRVLARSFASPRYGTVNRLFGLIEFENGAMATVSASRRTDFSQPLIIGCTEGSIRLETAFNPVGNSEIVIKRSAGLIGQRIERIPITMPEPKSERLIDLHVFTLQLQHFAEIIAGKAKPCITMNESVINSRTRDALIISGETNGWCDV